MQIGMFILNSLMFGVALAVDSFLVALASGAKAPFTRRSHVLCSATVFALFQFGASVLGWVIARAAFAEFSRMAFYFSWLAFIVMLALGIKTLFELRAKSDAPHPADNAGWWAMIVQCAATSVDALTVGFTAEEYGAAAALACAAIISVITFAAYPIGFVVGKRFGTRFEKAAVILGGSVFIAIAVEILVGAYV